LKNLRSEGKIIQNWQEDIAQPIVSIICVTYNHEDYIEDAIRGFLIQETNFPFEILIHDDASTDNTANIIKQYEKQYPKLFRTIYQTENQYSKGNKPGLILTKIAKGKYIAICEGDDYWTDSLKLQKQVNYLETHPEVVITTFKAIAKDELGTSNFKEVPAKEYQKSFSAYDLLHNNSSWLPTLNCVFRKIDFGEIPERSKVQAGDKFLTSLLGNYGSSYFHTDIKPSAYRVHSGGVWSRLDNIEKAESAVNSYFWIYKYYKRIGNEEVAKSFFRHYNLYYRSLLRQKYGNNYRENNFHNNFSKISRDVKKLRNELKDSKILIYGYSELGQYFSSLLKDNFVGYIDKNANQIINNDVFSIDEINNIEHNYILLSLMGREQQVFNDILSVLHSAIKMIVFNESTELDLYLLNSNDNKPILLKEDMIFSQSNNE